MKYLILTIFFIISYSCKNSNYYANNKKNSVINSFAMKDKEHIIRFLSTDYRRFTDYYISFEGYNKGKKVPVCTWPSTLRPIAEKRGMKYGNFIQQLLHERIQIDVSELQDSTDWIVKSNITIDSLYNINPDLLYSYYFKPNNITPTLGFNKRLSLADKLFRLNILVYLGEESHLGIEKDTIIKRTILGN